MPRGNGTFSHEREQKEKKVETLQFKNNSLFRMVIEETNPSLWMCQINLAQAWAQVRLLWDVSPMACSD